MLEIKTEAQETDFVLEEALILHLACDHHLASWVKGKSKIELEMCHDRQHASNCDHEHKKKIRIAKEI
jgi:hypothetical protein